MGNYKFRSNEIILLGDTHSTSVVRDIIATRIPDGSDIIHLGDVGLGFGDLSYSIDNALSWLGIFNKLCSKLNINLYLIRGNHDNTSLKIWDSKWSNVFLIHNNAYATFPNGKKVLFLGGGISIDRIARIPKNDYWTDEATHPIEDVEKCDIMFSHDSPECFNHSSHTIPTHWKIYNDKDVTLYDDCVNQRKLVGEIVSKSEVSTIFYGHFHNSTRQQIDGVYARCIDINELEFFNANKTYTI